VYGPCASISPTSLPSLSPASCVGEGGGEKLFDEFLALSLTVVLVKVVVAVVVVVVVVFFFRGGGVVGGGRSFFRGGIAGAAVSVGGDLSMDGLTSDDLPPHTSTAAELT